MENLLKNHFNKRMKRWDVNDHKPNDARCDFYDCLGGPVICPFLLSN
jgi:hypothetical protein